LVVLPHEKVGAFLASIFLPGSRSRYNNIMLLGICLIFCLIALWLYRRISVADRGFILGYFFITIFFAVLSINFLFVLNVEAIHFIQYALFAIICFQINNSYFKTMFWSVVAGTVDELYQYVYLAPQNKYFDWNDVVINAIGVGLGLVIIRALQFKSIRFNWKKMHTSIEAIFLLFLIIFLLWGFKTGYIAYGPDPDASFVFFRKPISGFWNIVHPNIKFHVVKPIEGIVILVLLIGFYSYLEKGSSSIDDS